MCVSVGAAAAGGASQAVSARGKGIMVLNIGGGEVALDRQTERLSGDTASLSLDRL